jgi:hypothetical protein
MIVTERLENILERCLLASTKERISNLAAELNRLQPRGGKKGARGMKQRCRTVLKSALTQFWCSIMDS